MVLGNLPITIFADGQPGQLGISRGTNNLALPAAIADIVAWAAPCLRLLGIARVLCNPHPTRTIGAYRCVTALQRLFWGSQLLLSLWACGWAAGLAAVAAPAAAVLVQLAEERLGLKSATEGGLLCAAQAALTVASHMALAAHAPDIYSAISAAELCYIQICLNAFAAAGTRKLYLRYNGLGVANRTWVPECPDLNPAFEKLSADVPAHVTARFAITKNPSTPTALFEFDCERWQIRCLLSSSDFYAKLNTIPSFALGKWVDPEQLRKHVFDTGNFWQIALRCIDVNNSPFNNLSFRDVTKKLAAGAAEAAAAAQTPADARPTVAKPKTKGKAGKCKGKK